MNSNGPLWGRGGGVLKSFTHIEHRAGAVGREGLGHLILVLTPEYLLPCQVVPVLTLTHLADLATERHLTTGKRAERTKLDFRCPICRSASGQASCLICACSSQLAFPFCC